MKNTFLTNFNIKEVFTLKSVFLLFLILHILLILTYFRIDSLTSGNPLTSGDLHFHFPSVAEGKSVFSKEFKLWAYSPNYMAGYPFGLWGSMSRRAYEIIPALMPGASAPTAYYILICSVAFLTPFIMALSFKILGYRWSQTAMSVIFCIIVFQLDHFFNWHHGGLMFPFATALAMVYTSLFYRGCQGLSWLYLILAGVLLGLILWIHPLILFPVAISSVLVIWVSRRIVFSGFNWLKVLGVFVIGFMILLPWLIPLFNFLDLRQSVISEELQVDIRDLIMDVFSDRRFQLSYDRTTLQHVIWVLAFLGFASAGSKQREALFLFIGTFLGLFSIAYVFCYSSFFRQLEPYHYSGSAMMFALVPAIVGIFKFQELYVKVEREGKILCICLFLMLAPCLTAYLIDFTEARPLTGMGLNEKKVIDFINLQKDVPGRVLCEDHKLSAVIQHFTGREIIGGPTTAWSLLPHRWSNVYTGIAFGRPIQDLSVKDLDSYLDLFNVAFVVTSSERLVKKMEELSNINKETTQFGTLNVFSLNHDRLGWIWGDPSQAQVTAEIDRIIINDPPEGAFVLKYHFLRTLSANHGIKIYPVQLLDDPVEFIGIDNSKGLKKIEIINQN